MNAVTTATPSCFGTDWDKNEPECAGGPHPTRTNPKTGGHVLERCDFYISCGARTAATKNAAGVLIPAQQLIRPTVTVPAAPPAPAPPPQRPATAPQTFQQWMAGQQRTATHPGTPVATVPQTVPQPQAPAQYMPGATVHAASTWQLNYTSPPFLSVPETPQPGESIWRLLMREVLRAMGKGAGHAIASFFDSRPLK